MEVYLDPVRLQVSEELFQAISRFFLEVIPSEINSKNLAKNLTEPPPPHTGDFAFGCFQLSKIFKMSPAVIAQKLESELKSSIFFKSVAVGPYLNIHLSAQAYEKVFLPLIESGELFKQKLILNTTKTMFEYSQPNTHKELHVGHCRNACMGDSLVRIYKASGFEVISSTFPGDVGTHVAKCLWYMTQENKENPPAKEKGEWLGKLYSLGSLKIEDEAKTPKAEENQKVMTEILKQLEQKQGKYFDLWKETREWSIDLMNEVYEWLDIKFDHWYFESDVDSPSVKYIKELYAQGKLQESQGAIGLDLEAENLGFCLLLKKDGNGLYATKDVELARKKFQDFDIDKSYYVVDVRQTLHFQQVFKVLEKIGFSQAKNCVHLPYNFVELPDGPMSSRKGNIIPLKDLINQMESYIQEAYLNRHANEWSSNEIKSTARIIAQGAIKYGMLKIDPNKKIIFEMKEWLKIEGDSGPFIQMSVARAKSILRKANLTTEAVADFSLIQTTSEKNLLKWFLYYQSSVVAAAQQTKPSLLCQYLFNGAQAFNTFYHECPISSLENESLKSARVKIVKSFISTMEQGLALLGVKAPDRM